MGWFWQVPTVYLAVRCQRHRVEHHIHRRNHIGGQPLIEVALQVVGINVVTGGVVEAQGVAASHLPDGRRHLAYALHLGGTGFHLAQLDAVAAQLHLMVLAAYILHLPVGIPAAQVAGEVHRYGAAVGLHREERTVGEHAGRQLWQVPVAAPHLYAGKAQLAHGSPGHKPPFVVNKEVMAVDDGTAYGHIGKPHARLYLVARCVVGAFRGAIAVDDGDMVAIDSSELLASCRDKAQGQVVVGIQQQFGHRRGIAAAGNLMVEEETPDGIQIKAYRRRHDMKGASKGQYGKQILYVGIKRERAVAGDTVGSSLLLHVNRVLYEVPETRLVKHGTLGLAGGARGINHIGQAVG